jgi:hypothetical protein
MIDALTRGSHATLDVDLRLTASLSYLFSLFVKGLLLPYQDFEAAKSSTIMAEEVPKYDHGAERRASVQSGVSQGLALEGDAAVLGIHDIWMLGVH